MAIPFEARLPGTPLAVRMLRREMAGIAADCGVDTQAIADVQLAVSEAATNVVMHAYAETTGEMTVTADVAEGELAIVIGDTGPGFDGQRGRAPGLGVGLSVIATLAQRLRIVSDSGGTENPHGLPLPSPRLGGSRLCDVTHIERVFVRSPRSGSASVRRAEHPARLSIAGNDSLAFEGDGRRSSSTPAIQWSS